MIKNFFNKKKKSAKKKRERKCLRQRRLLRSWTERTESSEWRKRGIETQRFKAAGSFFA